VSPRVCLYKTKNSIFIYYDINIHNCNFKTLVETIYKYRAVTHARRYRYTFLGYFCCTLYTLAPVVVLRLNFPGRADRPTVPNHNNMLNYYYCRLRLCYYYILHSATVYIIYIYIYIYVGAHHA